MTPEEFLEKMKQILSRESEVTESSTNTSTSQNIIAKPRKGYISARDILNVFNMSKDVYSNLLVRQSTQ